MPIHRVAIVGSESLLGKETREVLATSPMPFQVTLIGADEEEAGKLTEQGDEAVVITPLDRTNLITSDVVVLAGSAASSRKAWELIGGGPGPLLIDATRILEELPSARLHAPLVEGHDGERQSPAIIAHPAAVVLVQLLMRLSKKVPVARAVVQIFEPASELGQAGIDELHQQTMRLFQFLALPKAVYDEQLAYNILPAYGSESPHKLERVEAQIERHFATLSGGGLLPSIRLVQAPVFHGHSISAWIEFGRDTLAEEIAAAIAGGDIDVRKDSESAPTNAGAASQDGFSVGDIRPDRNQRRAWWLWAAADNLRTTAVNTVRLIEKWSLNNGTTA